MWFLLWMLHDGSFLVGCYVVMSFCDGLLCDAWIRLWWILNKDPFLCWCTTHILVNPSLLAVFPREERGRLDLQEARQESSSLASEVSRLKGKQEDLESVLEVARRETGARDAEIKVTWKVLGAAIQRRGSILAWPVILSVYGADTIATDLSLSALISWFMK